TGRQNAGDLAQAWPESPVTAQIQRRAVGGQQMKAGNLVAGDLRERVERDAEHLVDVGAHADRPADAEQDAEVRLDVRRPGARRSPEQHLESLELPAGEVAEVERVA